GKVVSGEVQAERVFGVPCDLICCPGDLLRILRNLLDLLGQAQEILLDTRRPIELAGKSTAAVPVIRIGRHDEEDDTNCSQQPTEGQCSLRRFAFEAAKSQQNNACQEYHCSTGETPLSVVPDRRQKITDRSDEPANSSK